MLCIWYAMLQAVATVHCLPLYRKDLLCLCYIHWSSFLNSKDEQEYSRCAAMIFLVILLIDVIKKTCKLLHFLDKITIFNAERSLQHGRILLSTFKHKVKKGNTK